MRTRPYLKSSSQAKLSCYPCLQKNVTYSSMIAFTPPDPEFRASSRRILSGIPLGGGLRSWLSKFCRGHDLVY